MKTSLKGIIKSGNEYRLWTGIPIGLGVTYVAGKVMPDFQQIESEWLYPLPYCVPGLLIGTTMALIPKTKNAGFGVLGATVAYWLWAAISNLKSSKSDGSETPTEYKDYSKSTTPPPGTEALSGARGVQILR